MQLNHIHNKSILTLKEVKKNCYYRFLNLSDYIFIYDKKYPYELIPIVNDNSDLKDNYHRFKSVYGDHLEQPIEILSIDDISFNLKIKNQYITIDNILTHTISTENKTNFLTQFAHNRAYPYMFHVIKDKNIFLFYSLENKYPVFDPNIKGIKDCLFKTIYVNSIDYLSVDRTEIHLFTNPTAN